MTRIEPCIQIPPFGDSKFQWLYKEEEGACDDWDGGNKSSEEDAKKGRNEATDQEVIFQIYPPATILIVEFPAFDATSDRPIEEINNRSQRTDVTAKASRDEDADG